MKYAITAGLLAAAFTTAGAEERKEELSPKQREQLMVMQFCSRAVGKVLQQDQGVARRTAVRTCETGYFLLKDLIRR